MGPPCRGPLRFFHQGLLVWRQYHSLKDCLMFRSHFRLSLALGAFAAALVTIAADVAEARGRISIGSRGTRTYSAPPATTTAPTARPLERTVTQPTNPAVKAAPRPAVPVVVPVVTVPATPAASAA